MIYPFVWSSSYREWREALLWWHDYRLSWEHAPYHVLYPYTGGCTHKPQACYPEQGTHYGLQPHALIWILITLIWTDQSSTSLQKVCLSGGVLLTLHWTLSAFTLLPFMQPTIRIDHAIRCDKVKSIEFTESRRWQAFLLRPSSYQLCIFISVKYKAR